MSETDHKRNYHNQKDHNPKWPNPEYATKSTDYCYNPETAMERNTYHKTICLLVEMDQVKKSQIILNGQTLEELPTYKYL